MLLATTTATERSLASLAGPANATPGQHWITAIGRKTGDAAQKPFTVNTDWPQRGFGVRAKRVDPYENVLTTANVASLDMVWSTPTGSACFHLPRWRTAWCMPVRWTASSMPSMPRPAPYCGAQPRAMNFFFPRGGEGHRLYRFGGQKALCVRRHDRRLAVERNHGELD